MNLQTSQLNSSNVSRKHFSACQILLNTAQLILCPDAHNILYTAGDPKTATGYAYTDVETKPMVSLIGGSASEVAV